MSSRLIALLVALLVAIAIAGCGNGTDDDSEATRDLSTVPRIGLPVFTGKLTKAQYLDRANGLCRESWADMLREYARYRWERGGRESEAAVFAYSSRLSFLPHMQFWFDDISYLGAPEGDEVDVENFLKALQWAVFSGEERRISSVELMMAVFGSFSRFARAYGLDECVVDRESFQLSAAG